MSVEKKLYTDVVQITEEYLGPAGKRFIDRQIRNHLKKEPGAISRSELKHLSEWSRLAFALLTNDNKLLKEYSDRLDGLKASGRVT